MQSIRITSKKEVEPAEPILKNIYQNNTYRKDLSWSHFDDEPRVQEKQQVKDHQSCDLRLSITEKRRKGQISDLKFHKT